MEKGITWVGIDAHKKALNVAIFWPGEPRATEWTVDNTASSVRKLARQLVERTEGGEIRCCYEAGPCGYALQRRLEQGGAMVCEVVAPSLIPIKPGERIKTDRRDARKLAELLRAGLLTEVCPPSLEFESLRDLSRCREDAKQDQLRCRHRLGKFLLRRGLSFSGQSWSVAHRAWLKKLQFEHSADRTVFEDYLRAIEQVEQRIEMLDEKMVQEAETPSVREHVGWLRCFRGIDVVTSFGIITELHGIERFTSPRELMAYLGLVPREHSSSDSIRRGSITKTGNRHLRRLLVEAAWHYRHWPATSKALLQRRAQQPTSVIAIADRAQHRLHRRYRRLIERGKPTSKAVVAVARELAGFIWAALQHPQQPGGHPRAPSVRPARAQSRTRPSVAPQAARFASPGPSAARAVSGQRGEGEGRQNRSLAARAARAQDLTHR
jgi:transposase